ncbi:hypothetical protein J5226_05600 [Lysobacter sp. K5869]|uniref:hypothetical protein n=1 Tax=Lysobacter sp. K5869 TaxID=2820808 RepID=UPI001C05F229|nr:hypothetical protein [Lysobacter sp. K5869]QWP77880.1 hypothetical protein J5226_05600 [Lysobacter sp. K5869]
MADAGRPPRRRAAPAHACADSAPARPACCCLPSPLAGAIRTTVALSAPARARESVAPPMPAPERDDEGGAIV